MVNFWQKLTTAILGVFISLGLIVQSPLPTPSPSITPSQTQEERPSPTPKQSQTYPVTKEESEQKIIELRAEIARIKNDGKQTPSPTPTPTPTPKGTAGSEYPTIMSVIDSLGHTNPNSWGKNTNGDWTGGTSSKPTIKMGTTITFAANASDPNNDEVLYQFEYQSTGGGFVTKQTWSTNNTFSYTFDKSGESEMVIVEIKDKNDIYRFGQYDDYTYMSYRVEP